MSSVQLDGKSPEVCFSLFIMNYLSTESEGVMGKSQAETLSY